MHAERSRRPLRAPHTPSRPAVRRRFGPGTRWYPPHDVEAASYELTAGEVVALRAYVAELARPDEAEEAERLLGQLAALAQHRPTDVLRFTPVPTASALAARAIDALRSEGHVRIGGRRWRLHRSRPSRASKRRFAPGSSPGEGAS
jgi:hypothetical protein